MIELTRSTPLLAIAIVLYSPNIAGERVILDQARVLTQSRVSATFKSDNHDPLLNFGIEDAHSMNAYLTTHNEIAAALPMVYEELIRVFPGCEYTLGKYSDSETDGIEITTLFHGTPDDAAKGLGKLDRFSLSLGDDLAWKIFFEVQLV